MLTFFSEAEARASRIAAQIENNDKSKHSAELENGDEEEAFRFSFISTYLIHLSFTNSFLTH